MRMLRSLCGGMLLLLLLPGAVVDAFAPIHHQCQQHKTAARRIPDVSLAMSNQFVDALLDFNSYFKKGLKFVLLPQSAESGEVQLNSFDSTKRFVRAQPQQPPPQAGGVKVPLSSSPPSAAVVNPQTAVDSTSTPVSSSSQMMSETVGKAAKSVEHAVAKVVPSSPPPPVVAAPADTAAVSSSSSSQLHDILVGKAAKSVDQAKAVVTSASPPAVANADAPTISKSTSQMTASLSETAEKVAKSAEQVKMPSNTEVLGNAHSAVASSSSQKLTSVSEDIGKAAKSVVTTAQEGAVQASQSVGVPSDAASSSIDIASFKQDPVVSKTVEELQEVLTNPPKVELPIPEGKGLAAPMFESFSETLKKMQYKAPTFDQAAPEGIRKVRGGFEVKQSLLDRIDEVSVKAAANAAAANALIQDKVAPKVAATNAIIKDQLLRNNEGFDREMAKLAAKLQENNVDVRGTLMANVERLQSGTTGSGVEFHIPTEKFAALSDQLKTVLDSPGWKFTDLIEALNVKELGGWYAGAVLGVLLLAAFNNNRSSSSRPKVERSEVSVDKIRKRTAQTQSRASSSTAGSSSDEKDVLESMVTELNTAVGSLSKELMNLKTDKTQTDYTLKSVLSDVRTVNKKVDSKAVAEKQLQAQLEETRGQNSILLAQLEAAKSEVSTLLEVNEALAEGMSALGSVSKKAETLPKPPESPPPPLATKKSENFPDQSVWFVEKEN